MRKLKITLLILVCILVFPYILMHLFFMPWYGPDQPNTMEEAKKTKVFIKEYEMNIIEVFDATYQFTGFKNIYSKGTLFYKRNKLGIVRLTQNLEDRWVKIIFVLDEKETNALAIENRGTVSRVSEEKRMTVPFDNRKSYILYVQIKPNSIAKDNLVPLLEFRLVPKE